MGELRMTIPDDLHQALRIKAAENGKTLKKLVIETLQKEVSHPPRH